MHLIFFVSTQQKRFEQSPTELPPFQVFIPSGIITKLKKKDMHSAPSSATALLWVLAAFMCSFHIEICNGYSVFKKRFAAPRVDKVIGVAALASIGINTVMPLPILSSIPYISSIVPQAVMAAEPPLTAADVLKSDIAPKVDLLKDILFVFRLYPSYVDNGDYDSLRQSFRSEPTMELRKTCKKLQKYLPSNQVSGFAKAYDEMIDSINDLDAVRLTTYFSYLTGSQTMTFPESSSFQVYASCLVIQ